MTKKEYKKALSSYPEALTASEVAEILRVCTKTVYKLIKQGEIPAVKIGRENRISKSVLISYLRNKDKGSPNPKCVCSENSAGAVTAPVLLSVVMMSVAAFVLLFVVMMSVATPVFFVQFF